MPKFQEIELQVDGEPVSLVPSENGATSVWLKGGEVLSGDIVVTYNRRPVTQNQKTRKANLGLTIPLVTVCEATCKSTSRGAILYKLDNVVSADATPAERSEAYDTFKALINDSTVRDAFINNGSFYS